MTCCCMLSMPCRADLIVLHLFYKKRRAEVQQALQWWSGALTQIWGLQMCLWAAPYREQGPAQRPVIRVKGRLQRLGPEDFLCGFRKRTILREAAVGFALHVCELMWKLWDSQRPPAKCCIPLTTCSGHAVVTPAYSTVLTPTKNVSLKRNKKYKNSPWMFGLVYLVLLGCVLQGSLCSLVEGASRSGCGGGCWSHVAAKHRVTA